MTKSKRNRRTEKAALALMKKEKIVLGYYTNWSQYRCMKEKDMAKWRFFPESIDTSLLTHICFAFAKVSPQFLVETGEWNDVVSVNPEEGLYERLHRHVKETNPSVKTIICIGGWGFNEVAATQKIFGDMAASRENREKFITSSIEFAVAHGFSGIEIDWEYPGCVPQGGEPRDRGNFALLMEEFRQAITARAELHGEEALSLSIAVGATRQIVSDGYDVPSLCKNVDWIGLMTYDLHGGVSDQTRPHTALVGSLLCVKDAIELWTSKGCPQEMIVLGTAAYGRSYTLQDPSKSGFDAPALGPGQPCLITGSSGHMALYEIEMMKSAGCKTVYDEETSTCYSWADSLWVGYDNSKALAKKLKLFDQLNLRGVMMWSLDLDDFTSGYPFLRQIAEHVLSI